jgi:hypothetical protein
MSIYLFRVHPLWYAVDHKTPVKLINWTHRYDGGSLPQLHDVNAHGYCPSTGQAFVWDAAQPVFADIAHHIYIPAKPAAWRAVPAPHAYRDALYRFSNLPADSKEALKLSLSRNV